MGNEICVRVYICVSGVCVSVYARACVRVDVYVSLVQKWGDV